jgi:hypothetical protein
MNVSNISEMPLLRRRVVGVAARRGGVEAGVRLLRLGDEQLQLAAHLPSLGLGEVGVDGAFGALRRDVRGQQGP